ncbi:cysteine--tRNA ligase [Anaerofilum sp. BX8]|uniref:Mini-ribonuclease 3 n=1 Tax=Anaerofilum hominis TaxID=2763016 RepID=A0A923IAW1_9FIRM|nr:ribonuclease III domain-containing protein [Anaerofilum hominis]MBC5582071.1 cysteine--tRNA ligase [Anaerofilum hominis]
MLFTSENEIDLRERSPLALAFVGDGVYELLVRAREVERTRLKPNRLHSGAVRFVSARGQFEALQYLEPMLTEAEKDLVRRGHNASKATVAKNASPEEYRASTGFECLLGYLYLEGRNDRIEELFNAVWEHFSPQWAVG